MKRDSWAKWAAAGLMAILATISVVSILRLEHVAEMLDRVESDMAAMSWADAVNFHAESSAGRLALLFVLSEQERRVGVYREIDEHIKAMEIAMQERAPANTSARLAALHSEYRDRFQETVEALELDDKPAAEKLMANATRAALLNFQFELAQTSKNHREAARSGLAEISECRKQLVVSWAASLLVLLLGAGLLLVPRTEPGIGMRPL